MGILVNSGDSYLNSNLRDDKYAIASASTAIIDGAIISLT